MLICMPSRFGDPDTLLNEALGGQALGGQAQQMHGLAWAAMLWFCQAQQNTLTAGQTQEVVQGTAANADLHAIPVWGP